MRPTPSAGARGFLFLVTLCCQLHAASAKATAIVAVRTPEAIGVAADSRLTVKGNSVPITDRPECKVGEERNVLFALAGFAADPDRRFDLRRVIRTALADAENGPDDPAERVARAAVDALSRELSELREKAPTLYERFIAGNNGPLAKVLLAYFHENTPRLVVISFSRANGSGEDEISVLRRSCPGECNQEGISAMFLADGKQAALALRSEKILREKPEESAAHVVERLIVMGTPGVGGPVDRVRLDRKGITWIERKPSCAGGSE